MGTARGRLVLNHSTHVAGLVPILERLSQVAGIKTITPGVIARTRGHVPQFKLKISVPIQGGFKLVARRGKSVQEVFVLTTLSQDSLTQAVEAIIAR